MTSSNLTAEAGESILEEDESLGGDTSTVQYRCSMQELGYFQEQA
jgi:hypothetical protein